MKPIIIVQYQTHLPFKHAKVFIRLKVADALTLLHITLFNLDLKDQRFRYLEFMKRSTLCQHRYETAATKVSKFQMDIPWLFATYLLYGFVK